MRRCLRKSAWGRDIVCVQKGNPSRLAIAPTPPTLVISVEDVAQQSRRGAGEWHELTRHWTRTIPSCPRPLSRMRWAISTRRLARQSSVDLGEKKTPAKPRRSPRPREVRAGVRTDGPDPRGIFDRWWLVSGTVGRWAGGILARPCHRSQPLRCDEASGRYTWNWAGRYLAQRQALFPRAASGAAIASAPVS